MGTATLEGEVEGAVLTAEGVATNRVDSISVEGAGEGGERDMEAEAAKVEVEGEVSLFLCGI